MFSRRRRRPPHPPRVTYYCANVIERQALISGLRELAGFPESNPDVPAPAHADVLVFPPSASDYEKWREVDVIASLIGSGAETYSSYLHYATSRRFGPVGYRAVAVPADENKGQRGDLREFHSMYLCSNCVRTRAAWVISVMRLGLAVTCWRADHRWVSRANPRSPRQRSSRSSVLRVRIVYRVPTFRRGFTRTNAHQGRALVARADGLLRLAQVGTVQPLVGQ